MSFKTLRLRYKIILAIFLIWIGIVILFIPRPLFDDPLSTCVYDEAGNLLGARIAKDGQWRFQQSDSIPIKYIESLIAYEDRRFYYHFGLDPISLIGAAKHNLTSKSRRGGSTITMQIMRLAFKGQKRSFVNKIKEMLLSVYLEIRYKKSTLLKIYASNAPFGGNVVGIDAASWRYYGKSPHLISWAEAATLAVLPNAPSLINIRKNRSRLEKKRNNLLKILLDRKIIDERSYQLSLLEPLPDKPYPLPLYAPHLVDALSNKNKITYSHTTSIDKDIQLFCNETAAFYQQENMQNQINNIAILVIENETGNVKAYVGNGPYKTKGHAVDMIQAKRSSGSIVKPFLFTAMLHEGKITPYTLLPDIPLSINGFSPKNFDKTYRGAVSGGEALQRSLNVPFVLSLKEYGVAKFQNLCKKIGFTTITRSPDNYGLSLILGGAEVSLYETVGAYASLARTLINFRKYEAKYDIKDWHSPTLSFSKNKLNKALTFSPEILSAGSIFACFESLKDLKRPDEEGLWEEFSSSKKIAWKTGTSFGHKDAWAVGVDAKYTVGIWVGNADGSSRASLTGVGKAAPILFEVFNRLPNTQWFETPWDDLSRELVCRQSGELANVFCEQVDTIYLPTQSKQTLPCQYHHQKNVTIDEVYQVNNLCYDQDKITKKNYFILPPDMLSYYKTHHPEYKDLPPFHPNCLDHFDDLQNEQFAIIYPSESTNFFVGKDVSGKQQSIVFKASHRNKKGILYWQIDNQYIGKTETFHTMEVQPSIGSHVLTVMDELGNRKVRRFRVE